MLSWRLFFIDIEVLLRQLIVLAGDRPQLIPQTLEVV